MIDSGIITIDTNFVRPMYAASHLIIQGGDAAFIDVGANHNVTLLLEELERRDIDRGAVKYVFLTHVHLDHAGGAGKLIQKLPNAKLVVHPRGAKHMIEPKKLIASAEGVYGKELFKQLYGNIEPVSQEKIILAKDAEQIEMQDRSFQLFYTEGHAKHHYCLYDELANAVFSGDSFGMSFRELDTNKGEFIIPITSPTQFDPEEAHKAIDKILSYQPEAIYLAHYSKVVEIERLADDLHLALNKFVNIALKHKQTKERAATIKLSIENYILAKLTEHNYRETADDAKNYLSADMHVNAMGLDFWLTHKN